MAHTSAPPDLSSPMELLERSGAGASAEESRVIVAHEVIWALSDLLTDSGVVPRPAGSGVQGRLFVRVEG